MYLFFWQPAVPVTLKSACNKQNSKENHICICNTNPTHIHSHTQTHKEGQCSESVSYIQMIMR